MLGLLHTFFTWEQTFVSCTQQTKEIWGRTRSSFVLDAAIKSLTDPTNSMIVSALLRASANFAFDTAPLFSVHIGKREQRKEFGDEGKRNKSNYQWTTTNRIKKPPTVLYGGESSNLPSIGGGSAR